MNVISFSLFLAKPKLPALGVATLVILADDAKQAENEARVFLELFSGDEDEDADEVEVVQVFSLSDLTEAQLDSEPAVALEWNPDIDIEIEFPNMSVRDLLKHPGFLGRG